MPKKPNYNFEKRQKELAREQKKQAKLQERRERKQAGRTNADADTDLTPDAAPATDDQAGGQPGEG